MKPIKPSKPIEPSDVQPPEPKPPATRKQQVFVLAREAGMSVQEAGKLAGYESRVTPYKVEKKRRRGLLAPLVPAAKRNLREILKAPVSTLIKASDKLRAAEIVLNREEPIIQRIQQQSISAHTLDPEDRVRFDRLLGRGDVAPDHAPLPEPQED